jgi:hypothetical protein
MDEPVHGQLFGQVEVAGGRYSWREGSGSKPSLDSNQGQSASDWIQSGNHQKLEIASQDDLPAGEIFELALDQGTARAAGGK